MHKDKSMVVCPHCDHEYDSDDMNSSELDLWALAPNEDEAVITCMQCDQEFVVRGGYRPIYTTAFSSEEIDFE